MLIYLCEKNMVGFLSAVFYAYYDGQTDVAREANVIAEGGIDGAANAKSEANSVREAGRSIIAADKITSDESDILLGDEVRRVEPSVTLAKRVRSGIIKKAGAAAYEDVRLCYAAGDAGKEDLIFRFLKLLFRHGKAVFSMYGEPDVLDFRKLAGQVAHEAHLLTGFIRFRELKNGAYYGYYSSDHDVLEYVAPHFKDRFNTEKFLLVDLKRRKAAAYTGGGLDYFTVDGDITVEYSEKEECMEAAWKQYHKSVSVKNREKAARQRRMLPERYRWFMNEF